MAAARERQKEEVKKTLLLGPRVHILRGRVSRPLTPLVAAQLWGVVLTGSSWGGHHDHVPRPCRENVAGTRLPPVRARWRQKRRRHHWLLLMSLWHQAWIRVRTRSRPPGRSRKRGVTKVVIIIGRSRSSPSTPVRVRHVRGISVATSETPSPKHSGRKDRAIGDVVGAQDLQRPYTPPAARAPVASPACGCQYCLRRWALVKAHCPCCSLDPITPTRNGRKVSATHGASIV